MQKLFFTIFICLLVYENNAQIKYTDSLKEVLIHTTKPIDRFTIINKIIEVNNGTQGSFQDTFYSAQLYRIAQQLSNDSLLAISLNVIGNYFRFRGDNPGALDYFFKAIPLAEKAKDKRRISSLYFDIAECYRSLQNIEESFKYIKLGEANLPDKSSSMYNYMAAQYYLYMAINYLQTNHADSALIYMHYFEPVNHKLNEPNNNLNELLLYGTVYAQLKDTALAELYFKKANILSDSAGNTLMLSNFSLAYIPYLLGTNQFLKAKEYAFMLLKAGKEINNNIAKLTAAGYLNTAYNNLHKPDSAYYYLSIQSALKDSVFNQNNLNKIQVLAFNEQIRQIDEEAKAKQAEEERKQNIQYALIALGIIIFITILLLLSRTIIVNERLISFFAVLGLLVVFEFINLLIHPWLAHFTHESPVLMLLALVLIAALLIPLHHRLEHWIKEKMIEKNKIIRLTAAKKTIAKLEG